LDSIPFSLYVGLLLLLDVFSFGNDLFLILGSDEVGNDAPSIVCSWWELLDAQRQERYLLFGPLRILLGLRFHFLLNRFLGLLFLFLLFLLGHFFQTSFVAGDGEEFDDDVVDVLPVSNDVFNLCNQLIEHVLCWVFLDELITVKLVIECSWHLLDADSDEFFDSLSIKFAPQSFLFFQNFGINNDFRLLFDLLDFSSLEFILFSLPPLLLGQLLSVLGILYLGLLFCELSFDSGVSFVGLRIQLHEPFALLFLIPFAPFDILLLHPPFFEAILCIIGVMLIVLSEFSPGFEVVPELIEFINVIHWSVLVTNGWDRLDFRESRITLETLAI